MTHLQNVLEATSPPTPVHLLPDTCSFSHSPAEAEAAMKVLTGMEECAGHVVVAMTSFDMSVQMRALGGVVLLHVGDGVSQMWETELMATQGESSPDSIDLCACLDPWQFKRSRHLHTQRLQLMSPNATQEERTADRVRIALETAVLAMAQSLRSEGQAELFKGFFYQGPDCEADETVKHALENCKQLVTSDAGLVEFATGLSNMVKRFGMGANAVTDLSIKVALQMALLVDRMPASIPMKD